METIPDSSKVLVRIDVTATDPSTETFIIDQNRELMYRGVGSFSTEVIPGLYDIKYRTGTAIKVLEKQMIAAGSAPVPLKAEELEFPSPAVLEGTSQTHEYHRDYAKIFSTSPPKPLGTGSQLFVFARFWTRGANAGSLAHRNPADGLTLHDLNGNLLVDFAHEGLPYPYGPSRPNFDPFIACNIALDPGSYRLRVQVPGVGDIEQIVVCSSNWQTQVFLLQADYDEETPDPRAYLPNAAILMAPIGIGFDATTERLRLCETARIALDRRRKTLARALLSGSPAEKNPMMAIYCAHVLAAEKKDKMLVEEVIDALRQHLGDHPDVEALALLSNHHPKYSVLAHSPPMLQSSWSNIVMETFYAPELVPHDSLSSRISPHLWGNGVWLMWLNNEVSAEDPLLEQIPIDHAIDQISNKLNELEADLTCGYPKIPKRSGLDLNSYEDALLSYIIRTKKCRARHPKRPNDAPGTGALPPHLQDLQNLGLPFKTLESLAAGLLRKLDGLGQNRDVDAGA